MNIRFLVDADSFPVLARNVLMKAAFKHKIPLLFFAKRRPAAPSQELIEFVQAANHEGAADFLILATAMQDDLVFTRDIPLAETLAQRDILVLNDRGAIFTKENASERRSIRDASAEIRAAGLATMPGKSYGQHELAAFANAFDRVLQRRLSQKDPPTNV